MFSASVINDYFNFFFHSVGKFKQIAQLFKNMSPISFSNNVLRVSKLCEVLSIPHLRNSEVNTLKK